jgi:uncharacterized protein YggT (Ycf19 family)
MSKYVAIIHIKVDADHLQKILWHVPNHTEISLALQIFKELVEPTLKLLNNLLTDGNFTDISPYYTLTHRFFQA